MTDNFKEIGSLFGREGAGAGFAKQTDKESFTYAFAWPEGDTWATLTGYLNLDEQPEEYVRRVLQDGGFRSDWGNPDYDPIGDFKETAGDEYRIPLLKVLLREQLESRYEVANHFSTMNRARVELSAFIQNEGGAPLPEDALGTPEKQGIRAMLIATGEPPREVTLLPDKNGSTLKPLQALVGGNIETFDIAFGEGVSLYVNEEGLLSLADARENDENFKSALDLMFVQIEKGKTYRYVAEYHQYLWVPSKYRRNSDGVKPADRKGLNGSEDFALLCWDSVNHLPAIRRISLKASLTSRLIDFKYLREAEAPAYTHGVSNDTFDYEFDDDDDDIPAFSFPEA